MELGLRERKKVATRQALHDAAVRLAMEIGPDRLTVEAIADEVGVSRRTFSNYFANKEEALLHGDFERMRGLIDMVRSRPAGELPWAALTAAAEEFHRRDIDPEWMARSRLVKSHPALAAQQVATYAQVERELGTAVAERLGPAAPAVRGPTVGLRARVMAAAYLATLRTAVSVWLDEPAGMRRWDVVKQGLAETGRGFES